MVIDTQTPCMMNEGTVCVWLQNVKGELPLVLGRDLSGVVRDIGSAVTRLEVGDEVSPVYTL